MSEREALRFRISVVSLAKVTFVVAEVAADNTS